MSTPIARIRGPHARCSALALAVFIAAPASANGPSIAVISPMLLTSTSRAAQPSAAGHMRRDITVLRESEKTSDARAAALSICNAIRHRRTDQTFPVDLVPALAVASDSDDGGVQYFSVRSLALLGPAADEALPALRRLLDREQHPPPGTMMFGISPVPQTENAIAVIEGRSTQVRQAVSDQCN
jgi:hypothetical protein